MGQRTNGVTPADGEAGSSRRIEGEISTLRNEIGDLVGELDRRRREAMDVRLQLSRHPVVAAIAGLMVAAALGGAVALIVSTRRRRQRTTYKAKQLRVAMNRMVKHPERVARGDAPPHEKIIAAIGTAAASLLVKRALERAVPRPQQKAQQRAAGPA